MSQLFGPVAAGLVILFARLITAVRGEWRGSEPLLVQRIYFANHASNGDFVLLWTVLPPALRRVSRPVAASDYWLTGPIRRFLIGDVFRGVLIDRVHMEDSADPIEVMAAAIDAGDKKSDSASCWPARNSHGLMRPKRPSFPLHMIQRAFGTFAGYRSARMQRQNLGDRSVAMTKTF